MSIFERLYDSLFRTAPPPEERGEGQYKENEAATYTVVCQIDAAELRAYNPMIRAEVTTHGERDEALDEGFGILAGYIFGGNAAETEVAMTVPVMQSNLNRVEATGEAGAWTVAFMMPARYTLDTLPRPQTDRIAFREVPGETVLVQGIEGRATDEALDAAAAALRATADRAGLTAAGPIRYAFYDDPMTPFWKRTNEVTLPVAQPV